MFFRLFFIKNYFRNISGIFSHYKVKDGEHFGLSVLLKEEEKYENYRYSKAYRRIGKSGYS